MFTVINFWNLFSEHFVWKKERYSWRLENLDALVTFSFEGPYEGGARQFLSARARGDSRQEGIYSWTLLYQWLIYDDPWFTMSQNKKKEKGDHGVFPSLKRRTCSSYTDKKYVVVQLRGRSKANNQPLDLNWFAFEHWTLPYKVSSIISK